MIIKNDPEQFSSYLDDTSNLHGKADILYIPQSIDEISSIVQACSKKGIPLTCSGARTGTTGGCVPISGAILSLEGLNKIIHIDTQRHTAALESGVPLEILEQKLNKLGYTFRAQPTESLAFIGAAASTCASGVHGFRYGSIRNYIKRLKVVLCDGFVLDINRGEFISRNRGFSFSASGRPFDFFLPDYEMPAVKTQAGYYNKPNMDLIDLFIGSEGTLGVIAELEIGFQKAADSLFDGVVFFDNEKKGLDFADEIKRLKSEKILNPTSLEFIDANSLEFLSREYPRILARGCAVYFEQEIDGEAASRLVDMWTNVIETSGANLDNVWFGDTEIERKKIYEFRHKLPQLINEFLRRHNQTKTATDIAVPYRNFKEMYKFYLEMADESSVHFLNFGHIGENHLHFNFLPKNNNEYVRAKKYLRKIIKKAIDFGGTVSAEHGIGKLKKDYLLMMYGKKHIDEMITLKKYFDPGFILGRDNIFDSEKK